MLDIYILLVLIWLVICRFYYIMILELFKYWFLDLRMYNIVVFERLNISFIIILFIWFEVGIDKVVWIVEI